MQQPVLRLIVVQNHRFCEFCCTADASQNLRPCRVILQPVGLPCFVSTSVNSKLIHTAHLKGSSTNMPCGTSHLPIFSDFLYCAYLEKLKIRLLPTLSNAPRRKSSREVVLFDRSRPFRTNGSQSINDRANTSLGVSYVQKKAG